MSIDADALADARGSHGTQGLARALTQLGFELDEPSTFGAGHVFRRGGVEIDVLAPDGLNTVSRRLTIPPAHTVQVPGGTQALRRTQYVDVRIGRRAGRLPRPDLLGAILVKARAVDIDDTPQNQRLDLSLLFSFVDDPAALATDLRPSERGWLRRRREMDDPEADCWRALPRDERQRGLFALRTLARFAI